GAAGAPGVEALLEHATRPQVEGPPVRRALEHAVEPIVEPRDQRGHAAKIRGQRDAERVLVGEQAADAVVHRDVGTAEAIDRLLGIAASVSEPGRSATSSQREASGTISHRYSTISAWSGSVSWNSSTNTWSNNCWSCPRTARSQASKSRSFTSKSSWSSARWRALTFSCSVMTTGKRRTGRVASHRSSGPTRSGSSGVARARPPLLHVVHATHPP